MEANTDRNVGLSLDAALDALTTLLQHQSSAAPTITELNPHHAAAVPGLLERRHGLAAALAQAPSRY